LLKAECLLYSAEKQFRNKKIVFGNSCLLKRAPQGAGLGPMEGPHSQEESVRERVGGNPGTFPSAFEA
jgi:hypothetical protein